MGGAVNNVATRKINCEQAAGLGGAFWGASRLEEAQACDLSSRPGNEASRGAAKKSTEVDQIERITIPVVMPELLC